MPSAASLSELPFFTGLSQAEVTDLESRLRRLEFAAAAEEIHAAAVAAGMVDLKAYAALMLAEGQTTTEEVTSVVAIGE